jgi:hypothetical protein
MVDLSQYKNHFDAYSAVRPYNESIDISLETRFYMEQLMSKDVSVAIKELKFLTELMAMRARDIKILENHAHE